MDKKSDLHDILNWINERIAFPNFNPNIPCSLFIPSNHDGIIPISIGKLQNLVSLTIDRSIDYLPDSIGDLTNLKTLVIENSALKSLPDTFSKLSNLETINFQGNRFEVFPEVICSLKNLKYLDLRSNSLRIIPDSISNLKSLEYLDLSYNIFISNISANFIQLKNLKKLFLVNSLCFFPSFNSFPENLEVIDLSINRLKDIPDSIFKLKNLKDLNLNDNRIESIPESIRKKCNNIC